MRGLPLAGLALLAGCAAQSKPITIATALHELQSQLQAAGAVSATGAGPVRFAQAARAAQCEARTANPEVPIVAHEITIDLTGTFTANGGFAIGPAITGGPPFGLSSSVTRGQTQGLTLPLTFAALSELPDVVAAQRIVLFSGLPAAARAIETRRVLVDRDGLRLQTQALIAGFDPQACLRAASQPAGPWHPLIARPVADRARHRRPAYASSPAYAVYHLARRRRRPDDPQAAFRFHHAAPGSVFLRDAVASQRRDRRLRSRAVLGGRLDQHAGRLPKDETF